jgi:hypothetical protein
MSLSYRLRQFRNALDSQVTPAEYELVAQLLTPAEQRLFLQMPLYDQRHCLDVYQTLVAEGEHDEFLLRAALYHDAAKLMMRVDRWRCDGMCWQRFSSGGQRSI